MTPSPIPPLVAGLFSSVLIQQVTVICVAVGAFMLAWFIIKRVFRWIGTEDGRFFKRRIRSLKLQDQELLNAEGILTRKPKIKGS